MNTDNQAIVREIGRYIDKPIVLVGLMGTGKTRIGRALAAMLGLEFVDSDAEIEKAAGLSVCDIFDRFGEADFRDGERRVIRRLLDGGVCVIATGGGAMITEETASAVWAESVSVWVKAEMPVMLERTSRNNKRPLLNQGDPESILKDMMEKRYPIYEQANVTVDSCNGPVDIVLNEALEKLCDYLSLQTAKAG